MKLELLLQREIEELHHFFQEWFAGVIPQTEEHFVRVTAVLDPHFTLVGPDGRLNNYATVIGWLRAGCGSRPGFRLWTEQITLRHQEGELLLATYEEGQAVNGKLNRRLSSVLFRRRAGAPNGLEWLHVHETWLPVEAP
jgi:hypothetical protein